MKVKKIPKMRSRIFKPVMAVLMALIAANSMCFAQDAIAKPVSPDSIVAPVNVSTDMVAPVQADVEPVTVIISPKVKVKFHKIVAQLKNVSVNTTNSIVATVNGITSDITADVVDVKPEINLGFKDGDADMNYPTTADENGNELHKNYSKTYTVDANDALAIDNRYGKVIVNTWARNEIKVDIQIKVSADDNEAAQKIIDNVNISDSKDGNTVSFKTSINEIKSSWTSIFKGNSGSHQMEINYTVYMPAKNALTISNSYGPIEIPDMSGRVTINSGYGSFKSGSLSSESAIRVRYGGATMGNVGNCAIDLAYGSLTLGTANKLAANVSYSGVKVDKVNESASINVKYGDGVDIGDLGKNVHDVAINVSYSNVKIGLSGDESANFEISTHYGDFNYDDRNVTITEKTPEDGKPHFTKAYKGYIGKNSNSGRSIAINANYGNVNFN